MNFVALQREHLQEVAALEREVFAGKDPWSMDAFRHELESSHSLWLVAMADGQVAGYGGGWVVQDEFHLLNLAVAPAFRRRGAGRELLKAILANARDHRGCVKATLEARETNAIARRLYESTGFLFKGVRPGYYNGGENAMIYWLDNLQGHI